MDGANAFANGIKQGANAISDGVNQTYHFAKCNTVGCKDEQAAKVLPTLLQQEQQKNLELQQEIQRLNARIADNKDLKLAQEKINSLQSELNVAWKNSNQTLQEETKLRVLEQRERQQINQLNSDVKRLENKLKKATNGTISFDAKFRNIYRCGDKEGSTCSCPGRVFYGEKFDRNMTINNNGNQNGLQQLDFYDMVQYPYL